jgi:hypothetical protein
VRLVAGKAPIFVVLAQLGVPEAQQRVVRQLVRVDGGQMFAQFLQALQETNG